MPAAKKHKTKLYRQAPKPPKTFSEAQERDEAEQERDKLTKAETKQRLASVYTVRLSAHEKFWIENTLHRLGTARTADETRFLEKIERLKPHK